MEIPKLDRFFAVTASLSIYLVSSETDRGIPIVKKIYLDPRSLSKVGAGEWLIGGSFVYINHRGIFLFDRGASRVRAEECGDHSSPIVALFLDRKAAFECIRTANLQPADPRWKEQTLEVLAAIGNDHPTFILSKGLLSLMDE